MRKNNILLFVLFFALSLTIFSCKKSSTTTTTTVSANVFSGSIDIYSSGNDTTLQRFLDGKYDTVYGSVVLSSSDVIDYKKYFVNLVRVVGSVTLYKVPNKDLSFLSNVRSVSGSFQISDCPEITNFSGLAALDTLTSSVIVERSPKFKNFVGLEQLTTLGSLTVTSNPALESFTGLQNVTTMTGTLKFILNKGVTAV